MFNLPVPALSGWILKRGEIYQLETWLPLFYTNGVGMIIGVIIMWLGNYTLLNWARTDIDTESQLYLSPNKKQ